MQRCTASVLYPCSSLVPWRLANAGGGASQASLISRTTRERDNALDAIRRGSVVKVSDHLGWTRSTAASFPPVALVALQANEWRAPAGQTAFLSQPLSSLRELAFDLEPAC